jgi:hypothetical protein
VIRNTRHLPGIRFETLAPPLADTLPRMDVVVFVGFAASGPLQRPVPVEDIAHFSEIFGADIALAREGVGGEISYGNLASAVRAFFRNGGRRCWIVRVAGSSAIANRFPIPGMVELQPDGTLTQAYAVARSEGSWSDTLRIGVSLDSDILQLVSARLDTYTFDIAVTTRDQIVPGDLLRVGGALLVTVAAVDPAAGRTVRVTGGYHYWTLSSPPDPLPLTVERLSFELRVADGAGGIARLDGLTFSSDHPRFWGALPADAQLYREEAEALNIAIDRPGPVDRRLFEATGGGAFAQDQIPSMLYSNLWRDAVHPRFPLAGSPKATLFLPTGMPFLLSDPVGPMADATPALERDGLATFGPELFLDRQLANAATGDLMNEADFIRYQSPAPRLLTGMHAALGIDEATIVAVPDALHTGWYRAFYNSPASPPDSAPMARPEWWHFLDCNQATPVPLAAAPRGDQFLSCCLKVIPRPTLQLSQTLDELGTFQLSWTSALPGSVTIVEECTTPDFAGAVIAYQGTRRTMTRYGRAPGAYFYRVRELQGAQSSDYSSTVVVSVQPPGGDWLVSEPDPNDVTVLTLHRALLRMCAARGDLFAVLSVPAHYREPDILAHVTSLTSGDADALSYGAIYHPWLTGREENQVDSLRTTPPDGAAAGVMARRSLLRGAWIAPANEPLHGVVALDPAISPDFWQALQDSQINIIRQEPAGFLCLNSDTLSGDEDLRPINVRRLLQLLRRAALKLGADYIFEPNDDPFRRSVQRGFEGLLDGMFLRGAFAGRTSREAFQVVTDNTLNTPASVDQGRFFVELRVAPSLPLSFLTVRLLQAADRTFVTEGK